MKTRDKWKERAERSTSGDMVWDILSDWGRDENQYEQKLAYQWARNAAHEGIIHKLMATLASIIRECCGSEDDLNSLDNNLISRYKEAISVLVSCGIIEDSTGNEVSYVFTEKWRV